MSNSVVGKIKAISALQTMQSRSGNQYTKQSVFLDAGEYDRETGEHYPNDLLLDFINSKGGDIAAQFKAGDRVRVSFRLRGRSWDSRVTPGKKEYGVSVSCYRIEPFAAKADENAPSPQLVAEMQRQQRQAQAFAPATPYAPQTAAPQAAQPAADDGLPF